MKRWSRLLSVFSLALFLAAPKAGAQFSGSPPSLAAAHLSGPRPEAFGTSAQTALVLGSYLFQSRTGESIQALSGIDRCASSTAGLSTTPSLPNGVLIEKIELRACDTDDTLGLAQARLFQCPTPGADCVEIGFVETGLSFDGGCGTFSTPVVPPHQVDNASGPLLVTAFTSSCTFASYSAVTLYYRLQVSPTPGVAAFGDVPPTHPFFRFIEVLAAAGITSGCGGGNFCPERNITRGEIAVFFAKALGLHFPN